MYVLALQRAPMCSRFGFLDKETNDEFLEKTKFLDLSDSIHCGIKTHAHRKFWKFWIGENCEL